MRSTVVALALASIAGASIAEARGLEYGPRIAYSIPTGDAGEALVPGVGYGLTGTFMVTPRDGFGVDIAHHRWSGSPDVDRSLDEFLSLITGAPISGSRTTVSAVQATMHVKVVALERGPILPWMKVGAGVHRFSSKLELPIAALQDAGVHVGTSGPDPISYKFGYHVGVGLDLRIATDTRLGLDVSFQFIDTGKPDLTAFTFGASLLDIP